MLSVGQDAADAAIRSVRVQTAAGKQKSTTWRHDEIWLLYKTAQKVMKHFL